jgi:RHS repeat-associated protein
MEVALASSDQYFGGRRVAAMDQLGSAESPHQSYFPWGEPKGTSNPQDTWNFATYWTDSATGLDYANNRYYSNAYGRFMTPDPYKASGGPSDPQSWNRYAYTRGDPVNRKDPQGLEDCEDCGGGGDPGDPGDPGGAGGGGGQGGGGGVSGTKTSFPKCNPSLSPSTTTQIDFIINNYQAATTVAAEADQAFQGLNAQNFNAADVLGWAAAESGYAPPVQNSDSGLKSGNLDYFNLTAGPLWINQAACPSGANHYWACFGSFQGAAEAALFSPTQYGSYQGVSNVSAGFVLGQQLGSGASLASAFQTMSNAVHYATNPNYGTDASNAINSVGSLLDCLQQNYASFL